MFKKGIKDELKSNFESKKTKRKWSQEELLKLKRLFESGSSIIIDGRSQGSIKRKIRELGLNKSKKGKNWTKKEISELMKNRTVEGRSARSIIKKKKELGLIKKKEYRQKWSEKEESLLLELRQKRLSAAQIFSGGYLPSRSQTAIQKKMYRMGLAKKPDKKILKFPYDVKLKFNNFLLENWKGKIPEELAAIWSKENSLYPVNSKRVSRQLQILNIKISSYEVIKIKNLRKKEQLIIANSKGKESIHTINERIRRERVKLMKSRFEKNVDIWTGLAMTEEEVKDLLSI